jgi:AcrR family transcriptional regulator
MSKSAKKILTIAEELFYKNSFHCVGVDLIRDKSGCSKTTMYTYFKNKQQLVAEVLKQRDRDFRESLTQYVGDTSGQEAIKKIYDWHINWFKTDEFKGCLFVRAVAEQSQQDTEIKEIVIEHKVWLRQFIHHFSDPIYENQLVGELIYTLLEGLISRFLVEGFNAEIAAQQKILIEQVLKAHTF